MNRMVKRKDADRGSQSDTLRDWRDRCEHCAKLFIIAENEELFDNREHAILAHERATGVKKLVTVIEAEGESGPVLKTEPPEMSITLDSLEGGDVGEEKKEGEEKKGETKKEKPYYEE